MKRRFNGMLVATAAGAVMLTAASAEAAFVAKGDLDLENDVFGSGGKLQDEVAGNNGDLFLALAQQGTNDPNLPDGLGNNDATTILNAVNDFIDPDVELVSGVGSGGKFDDGTTPGDIFGNPGDGCNVGCVFEPGAPFGFYVVGYDGLFALFSNGGDLAKAEFTLGSDNFETSNLTVLTPLPAAAWMMMGGLGLIAGAARKLRPPQAQAA